MSKGEPIYISKLDAAVRQLDQAIKMFFVYGDPVSIHALASASLQILLDIGKKQGVKGMLMDMSIIREEKRKEVLEFLRKPQNFFKHSDREGQEKEILEFIPNLTEFFLYDACQLYMKISGEQRELNQIFSVWFYLNHPGVLADKELEKKIIELASGLKLDPLNRSAFLNILPELVRSNAL